MRINGRTLRPSTLAERRFLLSLGTPSVRVPRKVNPYMIARRLRRAAQSADVLEVREIVASFRRTPPLPSPDADTNVPVDVHEPHAS